MDEIEELYQMLPEGSFADVDELRSYVSENGVGDFFDSMPQGAFSDKDEYENYFSKGLKKKDATNVTSRNQNVVSPETTESGLLGTSQTSPDDNRGQLVKDIDSGKFDDRIEQLQTENDVVAPKTETFLKDDYSVNERRGINDDLGNNAPEYVEVEGFDNERMNQLNNRLFNEGILTVDEIKEVDTEIDRKKNKEFTWFEKFQLKTGLKNESEFDFADYEKEREEAVEAKIKQKQSDFFNNLDNDEREIFNNWNKKRGEKLSAESNVADAFNEKINEEIFKPASKKIEQLDNIIKQIESKPKDEITEQDINAYNNVVADRNKTVEDLQPYYKQYEANRKTLNNNIDDLMTFDREVDLSKRDYSFYANRIEPIGEGFKNILGGAVDLAESNILQLSENVALHIAGQMSDEIEQDTKEFFKKQKDKSAEWAAQGAKNRQIQSENKRIPRSIDNVNGIGDFAEYTGTAFVEQAPIYATLIATGGTGLAFVAASSGGNEFGELMLQNQDPKNFNKVSYGEAVMTGNAFAGAEYAFEKFTLGWLNKNKRLIASATKESKNQLTKSTFKESFKKVIDNSYKTLKTANKEGLTEVFTEIAQKGAENIIANKDNDIFDIDKETYIKSFITAGGMNATSSSISWAVGAYSTSENRKNVSKNTQEILKYQKILETENLEPAVRKQYQENIAKLEKANKTIINDSAEMVYNLSDPDFKKVTNINNKLRALKVTAEKNKGNEDLQNSLKEEHNKLETEKNEIITNAQTQETTQETKKQEVETTTPETQIKSEKGIDETQAQGDTTIDADVQPGIDDDTDTDGNENVSASANVEPSETEVDIDAFVGKNKKTAATETGTKVVGNEIVEQSPIEKQEVKLQKAIDDFGADSNEAKREQKLLDALNKAKNRQEKTEVSFKNGKTTVTGSANYGSQQTKEKAIKDAINDGIYDDIPDTDISEATNPDEASKFIAEKSQSPIEVASEITRIKEASDPQKQQEEDIESILLGGVNTKSYEGNTGNKSKDRKTAINLKYLRSNGMTLDNVAREIERVLYGDDYNANNPRVSEQDVVDWMDRLADGSSKTDEQIALEQRFSELTGLPATKGNVDLVAQRGKSDTKQKVEEEINFEEEVDDEVPFSLSDQKPFESDNKEVATLESLQEAFPEATVVQTESELPTPVKNNIKRQRVEGLVKGVYYQGKVYIVADNVKTIGEATGTYRHEILGHKGVIEQLGEKLQEFAHSIVDNAKGKQLEELKKLAKRYGLDPDVKNLSDKDKKLLGEEYIAKLSEHKTEYPGLWQDLVNTIRQALRDLGIKLEVTDAEIEALIRKVEDNKSKKSSTLATDEKAQVSKRSTQEELRGGNEADSRMAIEPSSFGKDFRKAAEKRSSGKKLTLHEQQDLEAETAIELAEKENLWIDDTSELGSPFSSGHENNNYIKDGFVYKVNNLMNSGTISDLFESNELHNKMFPETTYEFVGFTGNKNRLTSIQPVFRQKLIDEAVLADASEIKTFMESLGFKQLTPSSFTNNDLVVFDLHPRNVLKDTNGNMYVVDAEFKQVENTSENDSTRFMLADEDSNNTFSQLLGKAIPLKVTKGMIDFMNDIAQYTNKSREIFEGGMEYLHATQWYENLTAQEKILVNQKTFVNALGKLLKDVRDTKTKLSGLRAMVSQVNQNRKDVVKAVNDFIKENGIDKNFTETEVKRLMRRASEIGTKRDFNKALDDFVDLYEKTAYKAAKRGIDKGKQRSNVLRKTEAMLDKGLSKQEILDSFTDPDDKAIAKERIEIYEDMANTPIKPPKKKDNLFNRARKKSEAFRKKWFANQGGVLKPFLDIMDTAIGRRNLAVRQAQQLAKELDKAMSKSGVDNETVSKALGGDEKSFDQLPDDIKAIVTEMRLRIDGLTDSLINDGVINDEQALLFEENKGKYVARTYAYFYKSKTKRKILDLLFGKKGLNRQGYEEAFNMFAHESLAEINKNSDYDNLSNEEKVKMAQDEAERKINEYIETLESEYQADRVSQGKDLSPLEYRKAVPSPIRKMLGEHTDPRVQFVMTVSRMNTLLYQHEMLTRVKELGINDIFYEENDKNRPSTHYVKLVADGNNSYSPLNGLYTTPEFKEAFFTAQKQASDLGKLWIKTTGYVKFGLTVLSPITQSVNFFGNTGFLVMNGLWDVRNFKYAASTFYDEVFADNTLRNEFVDLLIEKNVIGQNTKLREINDDIGDSFEKDLIGKLKKNKVSKVAGVALSVPQKLYKASDDFFKAYSFYNEANSYAKALYGVPFNELQGAQRDEIITKAAEVTKNTLANYDRVYKGAQQPRKVTGNLVGNFLSFQAESMRTLINATQYAVEDIKDLKTQSVGYRRLSGIMAYAGGYTTLQYYLAKMSGMAMSGLWGMMFDDDEDEEVQRRNDLNRISAPWTRSTEKFYQMNDDGSYDYYTVGNVNPYKIVFGTMNAITNGSVVSKEGGSSAAISELLSSFIEPDLTLSTGIHAAFGRDEYGREIGGGINRAIYVGERLMPGFAKEIMKNTDDKPNNDFEWINLVGVKKYNVDPNVVLNISLSNYQKKYNDLASKNYKIENKYNPKKKRWEKKEYISLKDQAIIKQNLLDMESLSESFKKDYEAAVRLGADTKRVKEKLSEDWIIKYTKNVAGEEFNKKKKSLN